MAENSGIAWTEATWNPWYGCTKISPGCKFCYMYRDMQRYGRDPYTVQRSKTTFNDPLKWKEPRLAFTCSWSDFFIEAADEWRGDAWGIVRATQHITYQILTKRPENIPSRLPADWGEGYPNVQLGVSVESPDYANRIADLFAVPSQLYFVSLEPLLAPIDIGLWLQDFTHPERKIGWVIVGGESGPLETRRECDPAWICRIVEQCQLSHTPVFVKQDSGAKPGQQGRIPNNYWIHEFPKQAERLPLTGTGD